MIEKIFFKVIGPVIIILGLLSIPEANDNTSKYYTPLQERAAHLLALNCQPQQCVQVGEIEYLKTDVDGYWPQLSPQRPNIYLYRYTFEVDNRKYHSDLMVFSGKGNATYYMPTARITRGRAFPERILYDPQNPNISLPEGYAKVLSQIPNPYKRSPLHPYIFMLIGLVITHYLVFGEGRNLSER